jgi:hypothetical protein
VQALNQHGEPTPPNGCRWCGIAERDHVQLWTEGRGWHGWEAPTPAQRRTRMLARRAEQEDYSSSAASVVILAKIS